MDRPNQPPRASDHQGPEDKVGYGKPPKATRFKKGVSGNPSGKAKTQPRAVPEPRDFQELVLAETKRKVRVKEGGKTRSLHLEQIMARNLVADAAKGDTRAVRQVTAIILEEERKRREAKEETFRRYETLKREFPDLEKQWSARGRDISRTTIPHPDDLVLDYKNREVHCNGPLNEPERDTWEAAREQAAKCAKRVIELERRLAGAGDPGRTAIEVEISNLRTYIEDVEAQYPSPETRRRPGFDIDRWRARRRPS